MGGVERHKMGRVRMEALVAAAWGPMAMLVAARVVGAWVAVAAVWAALEVWAGVRGEAVAVWAAELARVWTMAWAMVQAAFGAAE